MKKTHLSVLVNPDIAHIVFIRGYIEKIGRGTLKIIEDFKQAGLKNPVWSSDSNSVKLTFFSDAETVKAIDGTVGGIVDGTIDGTTAEVKQKLKDLLLAIYKDEGKKAKDYAKTIDVSQRTIERYVKLLSDSGLIEFRGTSNQTGGYYVAKKVKTVVDK